MTAFVDLSARAHEHQHSLDSITALNASLRDSEVRARAVLQNVADGIVTVDEQGLIESMNRSAQGLFGYEQAELIGQPLQSVIAPSHRDEFTEAAAVNRTLRSAGDSPAEPIETVGCRKDGSQFAIEIGISEMQIGGADVHDRRDPRHHRARRARRARADQRPGAASRGTT